MAASDTPLTEYFSRFVPYAMALRYLAGDACWRPIQALAAVVIDDPLLRTKYGFLNFRSLLSMTRKITSTRPLVSFRITSGGTHGELCASFWRTQSAFPSAFTGTTIPRESLPPRTAGFWTSCCASPRNGWRSIRSEQGWHVIRSWFFLKGSSPGEAMGALRSHNFYAAVNTVPHPAHRTRLSDTARGCTARSPSVRSFSALPAQTSQQDSPGRYRIQRILRAAGSDRRASPGFRRRRTTHSQSGGTRSTALSRRCNGQVSPPSRSQSAALP